MKRNLGRTPPRYSPNPMQVSEFDTFSLKLKTGFQALQYLRYLLTSFYANGQQFASQQDEASFYLVGEYFEHYRNPGFYQQHALEFLKLRMLARLVRTRLSRELLRHEREQQKLLLAQRVLLNPRAFRGQKHQWEGGFLHVNNRRLKRPSPEPRRIGVGYRDKGTAGDPSYDASPSWQTVAVSEKVRYGVIRSRSPSWYDQIEFF